LETEKTYKIFLEMASQGEFQHLAILPHMASLRWWCRKTDKTYTPVECKTLLEALVDVLQQAHEDEEPWVSDETVAETEKRIGSKIYIPEIPK